MQNLPQSGIDSKPESDPKRIETAIGILALALYVIERCLAFVYLQSRSISGTAGWESQVLEFFFGQPPYSIFNILFGFGVPEALLSILNPRNIAQAVLQAVLFLLNWWLVGLPFRLILFIEKRRIEQE
jgi:hypothetical protein